MVEGVYRYYVKAPALDLAESLQVSFFHVQQKSKEPRSIETAMMVNPVGNCG